MFCKNWAPRRCFCCCWYILLNTVKQGLSLRRLFYVTRLKRIRIRTPHWNGNCSVQGHSKLCACTYQTKGKKKYQRRGKAVVEKPLQLLQVMLHDKSHLTGTKPFAAQLRLDSTGDFFWLTTAGWSAKPKPPQNSTTRFVQWIPTGMLLEIRERKL